MFEPRWTQRIAQGGLILAAGALAASATAQSPEEILRRSDVSTLAPDSFRASLTVESRGGWPT